jgi:predicted alpha/beta superfamily hydrolase
MKRITAILTHAFIGIFMFLISTEALGQNTSLPPMLIMKGHLLKSTVNGKTYQLYISLPGDYNPADTVHYPVLYILDGNYSFPLVSIRKTLDLGKEIEGVIIVAIGDSDQSTPSWFFSRWTDYTPSYDANTDSMTAKNFNIPAGILKSGGAPAFLNTIRKDIIPFIDKIYKTTDDRGIAGHSLGGLFTGYCLLTVPDLFKRYGIMSPSFWWNKKEIFSMENYFAKKNKALNAKIFISVGSLEGSLEPESMVPNMISFADSLNSRHYKGLTLTSQVFDNETHLSVIPASISRMLRVLYPAKK